MLLHFDTLISKVLFLFSIISLGNIKLKNHLQSLMTLMLDDLNSFINNEVDVLLFTDCISANINANQLATYTDR